MAGRIEIRQPNAFHTFNGFGNGFGIGIDCDHSALAALGGLVNQPSAFVGNVVEILFGQHSRSAQGGVFAVTMPGEKIGRDSQGFQQPNIPIPAAPNAGWATSVWANMSRVVFSAAGVNVEAG